MKISQVLCILLYNWLLKSRVMGSSYGQVKPETIRIVFAASLLSIRNYRVRSKTGWLRNRIMCPSGATCLNSKLFQWASTKKIQLGMLVKDDIIILLKCDILSPCFSWNIAHLVLKNNVPIPLLIYIRAIKYA